MRAKICNSRYQASFIRVRSIHIYGSIARVVHRSSSATIFAKKSMESLSHLLICSATLWESKRCNALGRAVSPLETATLMYSKRVKLWSLLWSPTTVYVPLRRESAYRTPCPFITSAARLNFAASELSSSNSELNFGRELPAEVSRGDKTLAALENDEHLDEHLSDLRSRRCLSANR